MITPKCLTATLLVIVSMTSLSPISSLSSCHFNSWGFRRRVGGRANFTPRNEISSLEPCDFNPQFPDYEGRFTIPEQFNGTYGMVTYKKFRPYNNQQIPTCWVYRDRHMTWKQAKQFCKSRGFRVYRPIDIYSDRALLKLTTVCNTSIPLRTAESWLGMERDDGGQLVWLDGSLVEYGWHPWRPFVRTTHTPKVSKQTQPPTPRRGQRPTLTFRTQWIHNATKTIRGTWCEKDFFRIVPCGHCMDRGAGVNFTSTFNCSFSNINFNNRNILTKAGLQSNVLSEMKESIDSAKYVSKMILGYKHKQRDSWVRLATYTPTGTDNETELNLTTPTVTDSETDLNLTTEGSQSFRTITAGGGTIDGKLEGNVKSIWLAQTLSDMECNADTSGQVGCWIEYYVKDLRWYKLPYPRVEHLTDSTKPARIHKVIYTKRKSMFDTFGEKNVTATFEMSVQGPIPEIYLVSCNGTRWLYPMPNPPDINVTETNSCDPRNFLHEHGLFVLNAPNVFTPDICNISFRIVIDVSDTSSSLYNMAQVSDEKGNVLSEPKYIIDELVVDVQPDCSSTLKEVSTTNPVTISLASGLAVTFITVLVLLSPIVPWVQSKLQGLGSKKHSNDMSSKAQSSKEDIASSIHTVKSDGTTPSSVNPMKFVKSMLFPDKGSRSPSFATQRSYFSRSPSFATQRTQFSENSQGTCASSKAGKSGKSGKSGISSKNTGSSSARSDKFDGSVKDGGSVNREKRGKKEPARNLGTEEQKKGFMRELSAHALEQMSKNAKGK